MEATLFGISPSTGLDIPVKVASDGTLLVSGSSGSTGAGTDRSSNLPAVPGAGTSFVYQGQTLNQIGSTIAVNLNRKELEIWNTSGDLVVLVVDDGTNTVGKVSLIPLLAGVSAGSPGWGWYTTTDTGRVRIFGTTGDFVYAREV